MKKLILITFLCFLISLDLNAYIKVFGHSMELVDDGFGGVSVNDKFLVVQLHCMSNRCELECRDPDSQGDACDFGSATTTWQHPNKLIYEESNANELFEYAKNQINLGVLIGTYTNNLIIYPLGLTYYRNVEWNSELEDMTTEITITISDGN